MKKTFFYNFFPTKAEENSSKTSNRPFQVSRSLVEIRDPYTPPDRNDPWQIRKRLMPTDVVTGRLILSHEETFEHIFRYWTIEMTNYVVVGNKAPVAVWDVTEDNKPLRYRNDSIFLEKGFGSDEFYVLGWMDLARNRLVNPGDEIGLFWDSKSGSFHLKLFGRAVQNNAD